jgi:hypothetical protein
LLISLECAPYNPAVLKRLASKENLYALALCLIVVLLIIMTSSAAPLWIYQGF